MHVVCLAPVPVTSLRWRRVGGSWTQTVVCKLTFQLTPGDASLSKHHDPIYERDEFPNEDRDAPLFAPSDLVPERPLVDVSLVGAAYAPGGAPVNALSVRLAIGNIDKRLVVGATETGRDATGSFRSAELTYAYGPTDARNPWPGRDGAGGSHHIELPQEQVASESVPGFGPLAANWPARRERLGAHDPPVLRDAGVAFEIGEGFDLGYFNAAPADQQLGRLEPDAEIALENLHPEHPSLRCRFPNVVPQVFVERGEGRREEIEGRIASVWIDARRGAATLTWQALVPLRSAEEKGRIWVAVAGPGRRLSPSQLTKLIGTLQQSVGGSQPSEPSEEEATDDGGSGELSRDTVSIRPVRNDQLPRIAHDGPEDTKTSMFSQEHLEDDELDRTQDPSLADTGTGIGVVSQKGDGMPKWMQGRTGPPPPPRRDKKRGGTQAPVSVVPAPVSPRRRRLDANSTFHGLGPRPEWPREEKAKYDTASLPLGVEAQRLAQTAPPPGRPAAKLEKTAPPPGQPAAKLEETTPPPGQPAGTSRPSQAEASPSSLGSPPVSAAFPPPRPPQPSLAMPAPAPAGPAAVKPKPKKKPRARRTPAEVVEMLWFDQQASALLRQRFRRLCDELEFSPPDERHDRPASEGKHAQDHHLHFGILTQAIVDDGRTLKDTLRAAVSETGRFTPPMVVLRGELTMSFEDTDRLRATAAVVKPIAGEDKKLRAALEQVDELLATPLMSGSNEPVRNVLDHLRKTYGQTKRTLSLDYLNETVERGLLEQRQYARRKLFGGEVIRGELSVGDKHRVVVYLPEDLERQLPLMTSFEARLVAEAHLRQDQFESHPHALKVITLGRVHRLDR